MKKYIKQLLLTLCTTALSICAFCSIETQKNNRYFTTAELNTVIDTALNEVYKNTTATPEKPNDTITNSSDAAKQKAALIKKLKSYKVTGITSTSFSSGALLFGSHEGEIDVSFKNQSGDLKIQRYNLSLLNLAPQVQIGKTPTLIFFVGTDLNFFKSKETIEIGAGFGLGLSILLGGSMSYINLPNRSGGIITISFDAGALKVGPILNLWGRMIPIKYYDY